MGVTAAEEPSQMRQALVDTLAGAISGDISPLDVIKIRFQFFMWRASQDYSNNEQPVCFAQLLDLRNK